MNDEPYIIIPTWQNGNWSETSFKTRESYRDFVTPLFLEPGKYKYDDSSFMFNEQAQIFRKDGKYNNFVKNGKDYIEYWDTHKDRSRNGAIFKSGSRTWYLPREYYMWLNFLQIYDKEQEKFDFAQVRDTQHHISLYNTLAKLWNKHAANLKKRQICSSYLHTAKIINLVWFEEGVVTKMGAALKSKVDKEGSWKFLEEYRNFLNTHTGWYRPFNPGKEGQWEQKVETSSGGRTVTKGLKGTVSMLTFATDATAGVGGPTTLLFHEEGGIAPKADATYRYSKQAMRSGMITTGLFIIAGSVGDLDKCEPLKKFIYHPDDNDFLSVESNLLDDKGTIGRTGLFIPEQWSMPPFIDKFGNSKVEEALAALDAEFIDLKKKLTPEDYQLEVSQRPRNIAEAFAYRKASKFPLHLVSAQKHRIESKMYPMEFVELSRNELGRVVYKQTNKLPILDFPLSKKAENKEGCVVIYERPPADPEFHAYYGSVDPVNVGKSTTSESLISIQIYKNDVEVTRVQDGEVKTFIEGGKLVAEWCGRFDDPNKNHEQLAMLIELYNAWTTVENNITGFIQHMVEKNKQKYLVPADQMVSNKDMAATTNTFQKYGWTNRGTIFDELYLSYVIDHMKEELAHETKPDGTIVKTTYGVERIPSIMLLKEMEAYQKGGNFDRLISWGALITFVRIQQANKGYKKRVENFDKDKEKGKPQVNPYAVSRTPFKNLGTQKSSSPYKVDRKPFKNFGS